MLVAQAGTTAAAAAAGGGTAEACVHGAGGATAAAAAATAKSPVSMAQSHHAAAAHSTVAHPAAKSPVSRSPCSTFRSRPASAAGGRSGRTEGSGMHATVVAPAAVASRPASAGEHGKARATSGTSAAAVPPPMRRSSSSNISSAWDSAQIGVMPPSGAEAGCPADAYTTEQGVSSDHALAAEPACRSAAAATDGASLLLPDSIMHKTASSRPRQKRSHVPGSGVFSPGVMAALQHVRSLQAAGETGCLAAGSSRSSGAALSNLHPAQLHHSVQQQQHGAVYELGSCLQAHAAPSATKPDSRTLVTKAQRSSVFGPPAEPAAESLAVHRTAAAGCCNQHDAAPASTDSSSTAGHQVGQQCRPALSGGGSCHRIRPASAGAAAAQHSTAADTYWQQPDNSSSATGVALSSLLSNLFTGRRGQAEGGRRRALVGCVSAARKATQTGCRCLSLAHYCIGDCNPPFARGQHMIELSVYMLPPSPALHRWPAAVGE